MITSNKDADEALPLGRKDAVVKNNDARLLNNINDDIKVQG